MIEDNSNPGISITVYDTKVPQLGGDATHHQVWVNGPDDEAFTGYSVSYDIYSDEEKDWSVDVNFQRDGHITNLVIPWEIALAMRGQMAWMERELR